MNIIEVRGARVFTIGAELVTELAVGARPLQCTCTDWPMQPGQGCKHADHVHDHLAVQAAAERHRHEVDMVRHSITILPEVEAA